MGEAVGGKLKNGGGGYCLEGGLPRGVQCRAEGERGGGGGKGGIETGQQGEKAMRGELELMGEGAEERRGQRQKDKSSEGENAAYSDT